MLPLYFFCKPCIFFADLCHLVGKMRMILQSIHHVVQTLPNKKFFQSRWSFVWVLSSSMPEGICMQLAFLCLFVYYGFIYFFCFLVWLFDGPCCVPPVTDWFFEELWPPPGVGKKLYVPPNAPCNWGWKFQCFLTAAFFLAMFLVATGIFFIEDRKPYVGSMVLSGVVNFAVIIYFFFVGAFSSRRLLHRIAGGTFSLDAGGRQRTCAT